MDQVTRGMTQSGARTPASSSSNGLMQRVLHSVRSFLGTVAGVLRGNNNRNASGSC